MAPSRLPAYAPTTRPGTLAVINPRPAPHAAPNQVHNGRCRSTSGRRSYTIPKEKTKGKQKKGGEPSLLAHTLKSGDKVKMTYVFKYIAKDLISIGSLIRLLWDGTRRSTVARTAVSEHAGEHAEKVVRGVWVACSFGGRFARG